MTDEPDTPVLHQVVYSEAVRIGLREFAVHARQGGEGPTAVAVLKELDRRLHVYPQFGQPLIDLTQERGQVWIGTIPPVTVRYAIHEERRLVVVALVRILAKPAR